MGFLRWLSGKDSACNAGAAGGAIPSLGQYCCLENPWTEEPGYSP